MTTAYLIQELLKQNTGEALVMLLTLEHPVLTPPFRACTEPKGITSRGNLYTYFPFGIILPEEDSKRDPRIQLQIDNVSREVGEAIEQINTVISVTTEIVTATTPDIVEAEWPKFSLTEVNYDEFQVTGDLGLEDLTQEPYPAMSYDPARYPGLF